MEMKTVHIGDLGEIKTGSTPSKKNPDNYGDYALWIKPTDINPDEKYTRVVEEMFSEKAAIDCRSRLIPANSICVPCIGTVGTKLTMTPCDCFVNQSINKTRGSISKTWQSIITPFSLKPYFILLEI